MIVVIFYTAENHYNAALLNSIQTIKLYNDPRTMFLCLKLKTELKKVKPTAIIL